MLSVFIIIYINQYWGVFTKQSLCAPSMILKLFLIYIRCNTLHILTLTLYPLDTFWNVLNCFFLLRLLCYDTIINDGCANEISVIVISWTLLWPWLCYFYGILVGLAKIEIPRNLMFTQNFTPSNLSILLLWVWYLYA